MAEESTEAAPVTSPIQGKSEAEPSGPDEINIEGYTVSKSEMAKMGLDLKGPPKLDISKFANNVEDPGEDDGIEVESKVPEIEETEEPYEELGTEEEDTQEETEPLAAKKVADTDELELTVDGETEKWPISKVRAELQKRVHFTREMKALRQEQKEWEQSVEEFEGKRDSWMKENQAKLLKVDTYDSFHSYLADVDPELNASLIEHSKNFKSQFHNPVLQRAMAEKDRELESTKKNIEEIENNFYRMKWDIEKSNFERTFATQYKPIFDRSKIKLDMADLKKQWIDSDQSLTELFEKKYAKSLAAITNSKNATSVVKSTPKNVPTLGKPRQRVPATMPKGKRYSHDETAERLIAQMGLN